MTRGMKYMATLEEIKKQIQKLSESEAKTLLFQIMTQFNLLKGTDFSEQEFIQFVEKIYDTFRNEK